MTIISGKWSDDYLNDTNGVRGWFKYSGYGSDSQVFSLTHGSSGTYYRFTQTSSSNADKHQHISRYFMCARDSIVRVSMSIAGCDSTNSASDHFRVYQAAYNGLPAAATSYFNVGM